MRKKQIPAAILSITEKVIRREVELEQKPRPRFCSSLFHQPKRPKDTNVERCRLTLNADKGLSER